MKYSSLPPKETLPSSETPEQTNEEVLVRLAYALLGGIPSQDDKGLPKQKYIEENSPAEKAAREALATLLVSDKPLDSLVRYLLAGLFDPRFHYSTRPRHDKNKYEAERQLRFTKQSRRSVEHNRRLKIGYELWLRMGKPKKDAVLDRGTKTRAIEELIEAYRVDEKTIRDSYDYALKTGWIG
jgi:hypothetical protein